MTYWLHHMQRAGGHAFMAWLGRMLPRPTGLVNDIFALFALNDRPLFLDATGMEVVISIEDQFIIYTQNALNDYAGLSPEMAILKRPKVELVLVRSPFNLFPSRERFWRRCVMGDSGHEATTLWKNHAWHSLDNQDVVGIYFDALVRSESYRERVADALGLQMAAWPEATVHGEGSSFNGGHVLTRYKQHTSRATFDKEMSELTDRLEAGECPRS